MKSIDEIRVSNLEILIKKYGTIQKLANALDRSHGQVSQWKNRAKSSSTGKPRGMESETARWIERTLKLAENWLDTDHSESNLEIDTELSLIPMMDIKLSAGTGNFIFEVDGTRKIAFRSAYLKKRGIKPGSAFGFTVDGDSMVDAGIHDGALVAINSAIKEPRNGKYYGMWIDDKYMVKEIIKKPDGFYAISHNRAKKNKYPDRLIDSENSGIIGQVFYCGFEL
ncbi:MAG: hypothetical protein C0446_14575 [Chitinophaga sp.]|nr:hypothetical protein [Chitinophaga sp.]